MQTLNTEARIDAPPQAVWRLLGDLDNQAIGEGIAERIEIDRSGPAPIRTMHLVPALGGGFVRERIDELDDQAMRMAYEIIDPGAVPLTRYHGVLQVWPAGDGATRLTYEARFDGPDLALLNGIAEGNFQMLAGALKRLAKG